MAISYDRFLEWAEKRWNGDLVVQGNEIKVNSIFEEDHKHHLWCNPSGGKKALPDGVFHCWKTDRKGSLVSLVMHVDQCSYDEALDILDGTNTSMSVLEKQLDEIFTAKYSTLDAYNIQPKSENFLALPPHCFLIDDLPASHEYRIAAEMHLENRKIPTTGLYICTDGKYKNRIVIPYYDESGRLIYFNARYLFNSKEVPKYRGPEKEIGVGKGDVVYMTEWAAKGSKVYFTEGEFNAKSLRIAGFFSGAFGGKAITEVQAQIIWEHQYIPVISLDGDKAGTSALPTATANLLKRMERIHYIRPPAKFKDWNNMLVASGPQVIHQYVLMTEKIYHPYSGSLDLNAKKLDDYL